MAARDVVMEIGPLAGPRREPASISQCREAGRNRAFAQTPNTFITSSPKWLITFTAILPV